MTVSTPDQEAIWLKQVPRNKTAVPGLWSQQVLENHSPVRRSKERPKETVDGPTLSRLLLALDNIYPQNYNRPHDKELLEVFQAFESYRRYEMFGET